MPTPATRSQSWGGEYHYTAEYNFDVENLRRQCRSQRARAKRWCSESGPSAHAARQHERGCAMTFQCGPACVCVCACAILAIVRWIISIV